MFQGQLLQLLFERRPSMSGDVWIGLRTKATPSPPPIAAAAAATATTAATTPTPPLMPVWDSTNVENASLG